jgi:flagellar biogenesis protein FliO
MTRPERARWGGWGLLRVVEMVAVLVTLGFMLALVGGLGWGVVRLLVGLRGYNGAYP